MHRSFAPLRMTGISDGAGGGNAAYYRGSQARIEDLKLEPETRIQRWRRHWRLSWKEHMLTGALLVAAVVLFIWVVPAVTSARLNRIGQSRPWLALPQSFRLVITGTLLVIAGGALLRARMKRKGHGLVTFLDVRFFFLEISTIITGIAFLVRAAYV